MSTNNIQISSNVGDEKTSDWEAVGDLPPPRSEIVKFVKKTRGIPDGAEALKTISVGINNNTDSTD